jgi:amino acid adenylation domain-containing protein
MEKIMPLTLPQQDIYYDQLLHPDTCIYNIGAKIAINGPLDRDTMCVAYDHLISQHDTFRSIVVENGELVQMKVLANHCTCLGFVDFTSTNNPDDEATLFMQREFTKSFNLSDGQLLHKFILVKVSANFHYLFSVYHHIIADGWGTSLMFQRLVKNYNELMEFGTILSSYPFQYGEFVSDDLRYQRAEVYEQDRNYWVNQFSSIPESLIPKMDVSKMATLSKRQELIIPRHTYKALGELAAAFNSSTFHVILAALYIYLGRFYNNNVFSIGLPVLNRTTSAFKKTVGLFMGMSPLRINLDFEDTVEQLLKNIRNQLRNDYRHQRFPLGKLLQELNVVREQERLFNVTLSYERHNYSDSFKGTSTKVIPLSHEAERAALAIYIREFDQLDDVKIDFDYNLSYFSKCAAQQLAFHIEALLNDILCNPGKKLRELKFILPEEEKKVVTVFNSTDKSYPEGKTIPAMFDYCAALHAAKISVSDDHKSYTYSALKTLTDGIAAYLLDTFGPSARSPVAVLLERTADLPVVLIGIQKAGRAYIPLDPSFPQSRLNYIMENSQASIVIYDTANSKLVPSNATAIHFETMLNAKTVNDITQKVIIRPHDAAYILYTSGSTGNPKGVEIKHQSVINFLVSMQITPGISIEDTLFAVTTYSFDISVLEFFLPLISGAAVYIANQDCLSDPIKIIEKIKQVKPSILQATPSFYQLLISSGWRGDKNLKILCGGDLLSESLSQKLLQRTAEVWNMYGPTETTIWSSVKKIERPEHARNIGKPIQNTTFYILDEWMRPVPIGAVGELCIGGVGLAKGYYKNEQLTNEKFIQSPFDPEKKIYRTGDAGKWNSDGEIIFLGRKDDQVKIRGYRIELREIEKKLLELSFIEEAVVIAKRGDNQDAFLVAFVKQNVSQFDVQQVVTALKESLPKYMIPGVIIPLEEFPITPNKKIDRKRLSQRDISEFVGNTKQQAAHSMVEIALAQIWKDVLGMPIVDVRSNFFTLGGHSIKAAILAAQISDRFKLHFKIKDVFDRATLHEQAAYIEALPQNGSFQPIKKCEDQSSYEISPAQRMLWLACQDTTISVAYNIFAAFYVNGSIDVSRLEKSFQKIIDTHEILRTNFFELHGTARQIVHARGSCSVRVKRLVADPKKDIQDLISTLVYSPFNLEHDLLFKAYVIDSEHGEMMVFVTHHLIMDGWSLELFIHEMKRAYNSQAWVDDYGLGTPAIQYRDYTAWSNEQLAGKTFLDKEYWIRQLEDYKPKETFQSDRKSRSFKGNKVTFRIDDHALTAMRCIATELQTTVFTMIMASINALVFRINSCDDFCFGLPVSGRSHSDLNSCIGMFVNTVAFRSKVAEADSFRSLCIKVKRHLEESLPYQDYPLSSLLAELPYEELPFDVMIAYQPPGTGMDELIGWHGFSLKQFTVAHEVSRFPMTFNFMESEQELACELEYDTGMYDKETVHMIIGRFQKILHEMTSFSDAPLLSLDIQIEEERKLRDKAVTIDFYF